MIRFFIERAIVSRSLYLSLFIGCIFSIYHIYTEVIPLNNNLEYGLGIPFTPYTKWIEFSGLAVEYLLFLLMPLLAALPFADLYAKDKATGFLSSILIKGKNKHYFLGLYVVNFILGGLMLALPLLLNLYLSFMYLPNITPDPIINDAMAIDSISAFFPNLYYTFPLLHTLFYIFLAFLFSGMYASICLSFSMYLNNRFAILASGLIYSMILSMVFEFTNNYNLIPTYFLTPIGTLNVSLTSTTIIFISGILLSLFLYIIGVKWRVVS